MVVIFKISLKSKDMFVTIYILETHWFVEFMFVTIDILETHCFS